MSVRAAIKASIGPSVWSALSQSYYKLLQVRFARDYIPGLLFDTFQKEYRTEGMSFEVPRELTTRIHRARFFRDTHELDERDLVRQYIQPGDTVLELGACLGVVSCVINARLADRGHHVAVEANPALAGVLDRNRARNQAGFVTEICLVSRTSDGSFFQNECMVMSSGHMREGKRVQVRVRTVEEIERQHGLRFDTVFMDIQGGELDFVRENPELLSRTRLLILEMHPHIIGRAACDECRAGLRAAGLQLIEERGLVEVWGRAPTTRH